MVTQVHFVKYLLMWIVVMCIWVVYTSLFMYASLDLSKLVRYFVELLTH